MLLSLVSRMSTLLVFQARILTQKVTFDLPVLVPEVECLIKVDLVAQFVGCAGHARGYVAKIC